jgi:heme-degrading monooxygenase HmoA
MHARVTTTQVPVERIDEAIATWRTGQQALAAQAGFRDSLMLVDRQSGKVIFVGMWESETALRASQETKQAGVAGAVREGLAATPPTVEVYEVASRDEAGH